MYDDFLVNMMSLGEYGEVISALAGKEDAEEGEKLMLIQAYLCNADQGNAMLNLMKLESILQEDSPYREEVSKIKNALFSGTIEEYIEEIKRKPWETEKEESGKEEFSQEIELFFEGIVGMQDAKRKMQRYLDSQKLNIERTDRTLGDFLEGVKNFIITGSRGSGKTTLAGVICNILGYDEECRVSYDCRNFKERKDIDALAQCKDVAIIIENMEDLFLNEDAKAYSKFEIINALEDLMCSKDNEDGCCFIFTGRGEAFEKMKLLNPRMETLFFEEIHIGKYTEDELWELVNILAAVPEGFRVSPECEEVVKRWLSSESKLADFKNTIAIQGLLKEAKKNLAVRYKEFEEEQGLRMFDMEDSVILQKLCRLEPEDFTGMGEGKSVEELCSELDSLIGLEVVKKEVRDQIASVSVAMKAAKAGVNGQGTYGSLHTAFLGNPGTGKTEVAGIFGKIYCALGILPGNKVYTVSRSDLVSQYIGGTARCVREACQRADGGVLFIDEAYSLVNSDQDSYGKEAVDTLIQEMENRRDTMMVILAGYDEPMEKFFKTNPGLKSRVPHIIHFQDYNIEEMVQIFELMVKKDGRYLTTEALPMVRGLLEQKMQTPDFGNARGVRNVWQQVFQVQKVRLNKEDAEGKELTYNDYAAVTPADIQEIQTQIDTEEKTIQELLDELYAMEGLQEVKDKVQEMVSSMRYIDYMEQMGDNPGRSQGTMHLIFSGNPGTGKSTVAKLLGQIYVKLKVLKKNTFILAKRSDLVAQYMGQTAAKVANKVAEADGGILFIDEAYQLHNGENDSYGEEAIGTLLSLVEEKRDSLMVILAGYTENMEDFMAVNPGLKSRFPSTIEFTDYSVPELLTIFKNMAEGDDKILEDGVLPIVENVICQRKERDARDFANARGVRNILDQAILRQRARIMNGVDNGVEFSREERRTIKKEDVQ